ncbi:MAG: hypothetical protein OHK0017_12190 [Patescibacteria group bacterium]
MGLERGRGESAHTLDWYKVKLTELGFVRNNGYKYPPAINLFNVLNELATAISEFEKEFPTTEPDGVNLSDLKRRSAQIRLATKIRDTMRSVSQLNLQVEQNFVDIEKLRTNLEKEYPIIGYNTTYVHQDMELMRVKAQELKDKLDDLGSVTGEFLRNAGSF